MRRFACLVPVLASLAAVTPAAIVHAQSFWSDYAPPPEPNASNETTISINGIGKVERAPDYLDVVVGIVQFKPTAGEAQAAAEAIMAKLVADVRALNLAGTELQTGTVSLDPVYSEVRDGFYNVRSIVRYRASITIRVRSTDLSSASKIIDSSLKAGANEVESVTFGIKEVLEAREEAIKLAGKAAKRKAAALAESLDLKLGRVITARSFAQQYSWYPANRGSLIQGQTTASFESPIGNDGEAVQPGKIEITAEVTVVFAAAPVE